MTNPTSGIVERMTVLDFIDKVGLKTQSISGSQNSKDQINSIRNLIVDHYGALHYADLPASEIEAFEAK